MPAKRTESDKKGDRDGATACAVLSYLLIGIIWYFADPKMRKNNFAGYHSRQAIVLLVAWVVVAVALSILSAIFGALAFVSFVFVPILAGIWVVASVFFLIIWILGIVYAATGQQKELPIIGQYARKLKF